VHFPLFKLYKRRKWNCLSLRCGGVFLFTLPWLWLTILLQFSSSTSRVVERRGWMEKRVYCFYSFNVIQSVMKTFDSWSFPHHFFLFHITQIDEKTFLFFTWNIESANFVLFTFAKQSLCLQEEEGWGERKSESDTKKDSVILTVLPLLNAILVWKQPKSCVNIFIKSLKQSQTLGMLENNFNYA